MSSDDAVPISALQHYIYCPRQCALIHLEQTYDENLYTLRGNRVHERVDEPEYELVAGVRVERALPLYSEALGLTGRADVVEFLADGTPYPVEYKAGARKLKEADDVQLCAQAMCLEDMLDCEVGEGSLYYNRTRRRRIVSFDEKLRDTVSATAEAIRQLYHQATLPEPVADERCPNCSLIDACMPYTLRDYASHNHDSELYRVRESP